VDLGAGQCHISGIHDTRSVREHFRVSGGELRLVRGPKAMAAATHQLSIVLRLQQLVGSG